MVFDSVYEDLNSSEKIKSQTLFRRIFIIFQPSIGLQLVLLSFPAIGRISWGGRSSV